MQWEAFGGPHDLSMKRELLYCLDAMHVVVDSDTAYKAVPTVHKTLWQCCRSSTCCSYNSWPSGLRTGIEFFVWPFGYKIYLLQNVFLGENRSISCFACSMLCEASHLTFPGVAGTRVSTLGLNQLQPSCSFLPPSDSSSSYHRKESC